MKHSIVPQSAIRNHSVLTSLPSRVRVPFFTALLACALAPGLVIAAPGIVSRSCLPAGAQESITVDWTFTVDRYWTASEHYRNGVLLHVPNSGWSVTWRSYAGHLGTEYWYGYVAGWHWKWNGGKGYFLGLSTATDCNLARWGL